MRLRSAPTWILVLLVFLVLPIIFCIWTLDDLEEEVYGLISRIKLTS